MLRKIKNKIKANRKVKYQKIIFSKRKIDQRKKAINYILSLDSQIKNDKKKCQSCRFYSAYLNEKNFITFYKKFNSNLQLKEKYNTHTLKKKSNKNACFMSYILFSKYLIKNNKINSVHKLNTILKINDLLILLFKKSQHINLVKLFKRNIFFEKKLLNLFL